MKEGIEDQKGKTEALLSPEQKELLNDIKNEIKNAKEDKEESRIGKSMRIIADWRPVVEAAFPGKNKDWREELLERIRTEALPDLYNKSFEKGKEKTPQEVLAGILQQLSFEGVENLGGNTKYITGNPETLFARKCEKMKEFCVKNQIKREDLFTLAAYVLANRKLSKENIIDFFSELIRPTAIHSIVTIKTNKEDIDAIKKGLNGAITKLSAPPKEGDEGEKTKERISEYTDLILMLYKN